MNFDYRVIQPKHLLNARGNFPWLTGQPLCDACYVLLEKGTAVALEEKLASAASRPLLPGSSPLSHAAVAEPSPGRITHQSTRVGAGSGMGTAGASASKQRVNRNRRRAAPIHGREGASWGRIVIHIVLLSMLYTGPCLRCRP